MYDVIIVGAGPAGATLARLMGKRLRLLLVDARPWNKTLERFGREKCCGGLLAPAARQVLARQGLIVPASVFQDEQPLAVQALDLVSGQSRRYPRAYGNMDRLAFEGWLLSLLPEGVEFCPQTRCVGLEPQGQGWQVRLQGSQGISAVAGRVVVGADGARSLVRRTMEKSLGVAPLRSRPYVAVQHVYDRAQVILPPELEGAYGAFFHPQVTDFYGWCIPKGERVLLGAALPPRCPRTQGLGRLETPPGRMGSVGSQAVPLPVDRAMEYLTQALAVRGVVLPRRLSRQGCLLNRPKGGESVLGRDGIFCIGEAGGWISPSSAEGFSYALRSAQALAEALLAWERPEDVLAAYGRSMGRLSHNLAWKRCKSVVMFTPWLRHLVMASGLAAQ